MTGPLTDGDSRPPVGRAQRVRELFWAACDLSCEERDAFVERECGGEDDLRGEIRALLASHESSSGFLDRPAAEEHGVWLGEPETGGAPERVGPYRILRQLGEGGMGVVWLAEQEEPIRRPVALKVIKPGMDTREVIARFESERSALARMQHSRIAMVLDSGLTEGGRPFFAMEYVDGVPVTDHCDHRRLGLRPRLELFVEICEAVQHAHQKAVIHRDLKPSNILVTHEGGRAVPKVIDFGIAKALDRSLTLRTFDTEHGRIVGTPEYMSPEQATSDGLDVDTRSDVYSLGVLLYELLCGALPFDPTDLRREGSSGIVRRLRDEDPPRPSARLLERRSELARVARERHTDERRLVRELRGDLDWIVTRAMEKDRSRRYPAASELAADVSRYLRGEAVVARPPSLGYQLAKWLRRHRAAVAAVALVVVSLATALAVSVWHYRRADRARAAEQRRATEARVAVAARESALREKAAALVAKEAALRRSEGLRLAALSETELRRSSSLAVLLAIEGALRHPGHRTHDALSRAVLELVPGRILGEHDGMAVDVDVAPGGRRAVTSTVGTGAVIWDLESGREIHRLPVRKNGAFHASFSPDGRLVVTAGGRRARLWDAGSGELLLVLRGHRDFVYSAAFRPDGARLVTSSRDRTARVWDRSTGKTLAVLEGHTGNVYSPTYHPDGSLILTSSSDGTLRVWDAETGATVRELRGHGGLVSPAGFSPDGGRIVSASTDGTARIWATESGREVHVLRGHRGQVTDARFDASGERVVTTGAASTARVWDVRSGELLSTFEAHEGPVVRAAFSPDGRWVVSTGYDETARVWEAATGRQVVEYREHSRRVNAALFAREGLRVVSVSFDGTVALWEPARIGRRLELREDGETVRGVAWSPDGHRVATASLDGVARLFDPARQELVESIDVSSEAALAVAWSPDGELLATGSNDGVRIWRSSLRVRHLEPRERSGWVGFDPSGRLLLSADPRAGRLQAWRLADGSLVSKMSHRGPISPPEFLPDGRRVVTASRDHVARVWEIATGRELARFEGHAAPVVRARPAPDGRRIVSGGRDGTARIWATESGEELVRLRGHEDDVTDVRFDPAGRRVATASADETARVWDAVTGAELLVLRGHTQVVDRVSYDASGELLATASREGTVRVWDATSGASVRVLRAAPGVHATLGFSPDGRWLMSALQDRPPRLWPVDVLAFARKQVTRELTPEELRRYEIEQRPAD